jgi:hypothetical protein
MLLTGAGQMPPPIKVPKQYKSIELNKMRRQCLLGGQGYAHFRHSIEVGIRLTLGFDWILNATIMTTTTENDSNSATTNEHVGFDVKDRLSYHCRIGEEIGGDGGGKWIQDAWSLGPNHVNDKENDISCIIKCPVWNPEIVKGGICPISQPGMFYFNIYIYILITYFVCLALTLYRKTVRQIGFCPCQK